MSLQRTVFKKIDNALALYYQRLGYNSYRNTDGNGIFLQYIIDEELLDDDLPIDKELGDECEPNNCAYSWMNNEREFPIPHYAVIDDEQKETFIFCVLQYCYKCSQPPSDQYIMEVLIPKIGGTIYPQNDPQSVRLNSRQTTLGNTMNTKNAPETAVSTKQASVYEQPAFKSDRHSIIDDEKESEYGVVIDNDDEDEEQDVLSSLELPSEWKNEDDAINSDGNDYEEMKEELMSYKKALETKKLQNHYLQQLIQENNQRYSAEINALKQQNQQYLMQQQIRFICNDNANQYTVNNDAFYTVRKMDRILINDDQQYDDAVIQAIYLLFEYLTAYMTVTCLFWDHQIMLFFQNMANHHNVMTELDEDLYISDDEEIESEDEDEEYIVITSSMDLPSDWEEGNESSI